VQRREVQQAGRARHRFRGSTGDADVSLTTKGSRALALSSLTQQDVVLLDLAHAEPRGVDAAKAECQDFAIGGQAPGTGRRPDDSGSGLREARPGRAGSLRWHSKACPDESRAAIAKATVDGDTVVRGETIDGGDQPQHQ